jgi:hypothetical protein
MTQKRRLSISMAALSRTKAPGFRRLKIRAEGEALPFSASAE